MKNVNYLLVCIVLMFSSVFSLAEDNIIDSRYFPDGMTWKTMTIETYMMSEIIRVEKEIYMLQGDTLIGEKMYHKLVNEKGGLIAPITEEGKKIYIRHNEIDLLLYDFGVEVGDTIVRDFAAMTGIDWCYGPCKLCVQRIDTITLLDGREAKCILYDNSAIRDIEFVGGDLGIFSPILMPQIPLSIDMHFYACCSLNDLIVYEYNQRDCENIDNTNDLDNITSNYTSASKFFQNGQILILRGEKTYTLTGQAVE